jgi:hypothetical protein
MKIRDDQIVNIVPLPHGGHPRPFGQVMMPAIGREDWLDFGWPIGLYFYE